MVKFKKIFAAVVAIFALILCGLFQSVSISYAASEQVISGGDGTYTVPVNLDLKMGADNFTNPVTVEKFGGKYYITFGFSSSIGYLNLNLDGKEVGKTSEKKDGWTYVTYTLSENNLKSKLSFSAYINAMSREMSFSATLNLSLSEKTSDTVRNLGERPAEFVPVISTKAAAEYSLKVGTVFPIPEASATLGNEDSPVVITAVFGNEPVDVSGGKLTLGNVGEYKIIYKATNSLYKTSLGNDSFSEYVVTVHAVTGENDIVKFRDTNNVLPEKQEFLREKLPKDPAYTKRRLPR